MLIKKSYYQEDKLKKIMLLQSKRKTTAASALCAALFLSSSVGFSAVVCGYISGTSAWQGGVFSVIDGSGTTVATSSYVLTGEQGCTSEFAGGAYLIRFTGATGKTVPVFENVYGCLTSLYTVKDSDTMTVVFNDGTYPFNNSSFCSPTKK
jgi:hypothetical protein